MKTAWAVCAGLLFFGVAAPAETVHIKLDFVRVEMPDDPLYSQSAYGSRYLSLQRESKTGLTVPEEPQIETPVGPFAGGAENSGGCASS